MGNVIFSMTVSLDGFVAGPDGDFSWGAPDEELHWFHNERVREQGGQFLGRRLYETMAYWEGPVDDDPVMRDFAAIWRALPKVVFSTTLDAVEGSNVRLATATPSEELTAMREQTEGTIGVGGAGLAATFARDDLIDEYDLFVCPVIVGGGTRFFGAEGVHAELELVETRTFASKVVHLRYRRRR